jgi:threonine aldolase
MTWFAAHIVVAIKPKSYEGGEIGVFENIVLLEAASADQAIAMAEELGKQQEQTDNSLTVNDQPANQLFVGVRKVVTVSNQAPLDLDADRPSNETEITYLRFVVKDEEALRQLGRGESVELRYEDG